jgi:hypothetical protein
MALNILVGHTGLVSFGHGAWSAWSAAALTQVLVSRLRAVAVLVSLAFLTRRRPIGFTPPARRLFFVTDTRVVGATYAIAFRWTGSPAVKGLGGVTRDVAWLQPRNAWIYYAGGGVRPRVVYALERFHNRRRHGARGHSRKRQRAVHRL